MQSAFDIPAKTSTDKKSSYIQVIICHLEFGTRPLPELVLISGHLESQEFEL